MNTPHPHWKWYVCGALMLATLLNYMDRQALPQTSTELKQTFHLGDARYGEVERAFSWAFAAGAVVFGFVGDRVGPRRLYPVVLVGWSCAGLATPLMANPDVTRHLEGPGDDPGAGPFRWLLICRTMLGLFEAGHWPCAFLTVRAILTPQDRTIGNGLLQSGASTGAILIPAYMMAVRHMGGGWEVVFWTVGAAGLLWVPLWLALVRPGTLDGRFGSGGDSPPHPNPPPPGGRGPDKPSPPEGEGGGAAPPGEGNTTNNPSPHPQPLSLKGRGELVPGSVVFVRMFVTLAIVVTCLNVSWQFLRAWLPKYLKESQHFSADATDGIVIAYYVAADLGALASGFLVRWLMARGAGVHPARVTGYAVFVVITLAAAFVPVVGGGWLGVGLLLIAGAGILGLHPFYYSLVQELPAARLGFLSGLLIAVAWFTAGAVQKEMGARIEATKSYDTGLVLAGVAPVIGLLAILLVWKSGAANRGP